jgi:hypothetical protein
VAVARLDIWRNGTKLRLRDFPPAVTIHAVMR